jgi:glycosyltransferase involved in cell wall biosynthesis
VKHGGRLRVLEVAPRFPPLAGGVEQHVAELAARLVEAGVDVQVLTTNPDGRLPASEVHRGVEVRRVPVLPVGSDLYIAPSLMGAIARSGPWDLVHVHSYQTFVAPLAMLGARRAHLRYVVTFHSGGHSSTLRNSIRGAQVAVLGPLLRRARRLIAVSEFERTLFAARLGIPAERIALIPTGAQMPVPVDVSPDPEPLILSVGRLERYKGHQRAIAAMPDVLAQVPNARLRIAGAGPFEGALQRMVTRAGLDDRVEIAAVPPQDRAGMATLLSRASVAVLLSDYEASPASVMEALALRRPVVVAYTSGLMEFADRGQVRAVPIDAEPATVAAAIVREIREPLAPSPISIPTLDETTASLLQLYREAVAPQGREGPA